MSHKSAERGFGLKVLAAAFLLAACMPQSVAAPLPPKGAQVPKTGDAASEAKPKTAEPAADGDDLPFFLDLDTGGHRAFIKDVVFSPDGQTVLSASDDKTIRIWDWQSGVTIRTLRGERGAGQSGKIFGLAISPDGKTVAAGGWFGPDNILKGPFGDVRLFDVRTGKITAVLKGLDYPVYDLAFSPDGGRLAAGGQDGLVKIWETSADSFVPGLSLDADTGHVDKVVFAGKDRIAATTTDNGIRLFDLAAGVTIPLPDAEDMRDFPARALAVSPDGALFAAGNDNGDVRIFSSADGVLKTVLPRRSYHVGALTFTGDGKALVISCGYRCTDINRTEILAVEGGAALGAYRGHDGTVIASALSPDGKLMATAGGSRHEIHIWDAASGELKAKLAGKGAPVTGAGITAKGDAVAWGYSDPCPQKVACPEMMAQLEFRLPLPTGERGMERPGPVDQATYRRAVQALAGWALTASEGGESGFPNGTLTIAKDGAAGTEIENDATNGYLHAAFSFLGDGSRVVTGGNDGVLAIYGRDDGKPLGSLRGGHTGEIHGIAEAPKAGLLLTSSADQTLALWNSETGELIVNMYFAGKDWIVWTPQGYYHSSPDGDNFFGWHVNQGQDEEGRFVKARQLKTYLSSPEIIRRAIILRSSKKAVQELRGTDTELQKLLERKPPEFNVKLAAKQPDPTKGLVAVEVAMSGEAGDAAQDFAILSNDRRVSAARSASGDGKTVIFEIPVSEGENDIRITGLNEFGYQTERSVKALGNKRSETAKKGNLYVLVIGAERYPNLPKDCAGRACDLRYPVDDAAEFLRTIKEKTAPLYQSMIPLVLMNREALDENGDMAAAVDAIAAEVLEPESDNIRDEMADFLAKPGPDDTTIVFLAGHGVNIDEDYFFIPSDGRKRSEDRWQRSSLVEWRDIQSAIEDAQGRRVMLIDTCHAANAFNPRLEKDAVDARIIVFSATDANNTAAEQEELGHGVFTYALLQGLRGAANVFGDGVRLLPLAGYIDKEVRRLTADRQVPRWYWAETDNFILATP